MRAKKPPPEDEGQKVPGYIVTFSDMVTLLLTFFVMLLSLANTQDPELFNSGRDSFVRSIKGYGLGILFGKKESMEFSDPKVLNKVENPEDIDQETAIDAREERTRRIFSQIQESMKTMPSDLSGGKIDYPAPEIKFAAGSVKLEDHAKQYLEDFCSRIQSDPDIESASLYVLGIATEAASRQKQWSLSALRAKAVSDYIARILPEQQRPTIYSWGAGPGKVWTNDDSSMAKNCEILISIVR